MQISNYTKLSMLGKNNYFDKNWFGFLFFEKFQILFKFLIYFFEMLRHYVLIAMACLVSLRTMSLMSPLIENCLD